MLNRTAFSDSEEWEKLLQACLKQKERICSWYKQYVDSRSLFICGLEDCKTDILPPSKRLLGHGYRFSSHDTARVHHYYFTALATVQPLIEKARELSRPECPPTASASTFAGESIPIEGEVLTEFYADEVCRMVPYYVKNYRAPSEIGMLLFPIVAAIKIYIGLGHWEKFSWCQQVFRLIGDRGLSTCYRLAGLYSNSWNARTINPWPIPCRSLRDDMNSFELSTESQAGSPAKAPQHEASQKGKARSTLPTDPHFKNPHVISGIPFPSPQAMPRVR